MTLFDVYSLYNIEPVAGKGSFVYTADGTEYLDLYGGHAVISIGHAHPRYVKAISDQVSKLGFYSNSVENSLQTTLAEKLGTLTGYPDYQLFLCNSGAEANENAIKLASFTTGKKKVLAFSKAFHGRTSGAVAATDNPAIVSPFNRTANVEFAQFGNIDDVREKLSFGDFCAVIIEGIQGVSGIHEPGDDFLRQLRNITKSQGVVLILDEIQSGTGRTGTYFAHQTSGISPDIITMAKGIGNGFPIGAVLISPELKPVKGMLGTTFGGNHLACAAAIAVIDALEGEAMIANAAAEGEYLMEELRRLATECGRGLMIGIEIKGSASEIRKRLLFEHRIFTGGAGEHTVRLLPALCLPRSHSRRFIDAFRQVLTSKKPS